MRIENEKFLQEWLAQGRPDLLSQESFEIDGGKFESTLEIVKQQHSDLGEQRARARAAYRLITVAYPKKAESKSRTSPVNVNVTTPPLSLPKLWRYLLIGWGIAVLLLLGAIAARGQNRGPTIQWRDEGTIIITRGGGILVIDCTGAGVACSVAGNIVTVNIAGGGGAPTNAQYAVIALDATLTDERRIVGGSAIILSDGGPNGDLTIAVDILAVADGVGVTSNNSGLELSGAGSDLLALLQGCAEGDVLKWTEATSVWSCAADAGATAYDTTEEEGTPLTQRTVLNFVGPAITATEDGPGLETDVTVVASGIGACPANQAATTLNDGAAPTCTEFTALGQTIDPGEISGAHVDALGDFLSTLCGTNEILEDQGGSWACIATPAGGNVDLLDGSIHQDTAAGTVLRGDIITGQTATPVWTRLGLGGTNLYLKSDGTDVVYSTLAAGGVGSCTNQLVRTLNADAAPTCATVVPADMDLTVTYSFNNAADSPYTAISIQAGSTVDQTAIVAFKDFGGADEWTLGKTSGNAFRIHDTDVNVNRLFFTGGGNSIYRTGGATSNHVFQSDLGTTRATILGDASTICLGTGEDTCLNRSAAGILDLTDVLDANTGFRIAGAATTGQFLRGDGTNFISSAIQAADLGSGYIDGLTDLAAALCGTNEILEDQGASWGCIATPAGGTVRWDQLTDPTAVTIFNSGAAAELFQLNFTAAYGATDVGFDIEQLTGNPVAGSILSSVTVADADIIPFRIRGSDTPSFGLLVDIAQPGVAGQRDSPFLDITGTAFDASGHDADWRRFVDVTSNAGASAFVFQSRIDVASFTERLRLTDLGALDFPAISPPAQNEGTIFYDTNNKSFTYFNDEVDVSMQIGQEEWLRVRNESGVTINNGQVVYIDGIASGLPRIALAQANATATSEAIGLATHDIENLTNGYVTTLGLVRNFDTSAFTIGDRLFLSASVAGALTATAPSDPNLSVPIGIVTEVNATTGDVLVTLGPPRPRGDTGIAVVGNDIRTASTEEGFLNSGALTCGANTAGSMRVHTTPLQYCDNAATPALQFAAYAASDGDALAGDTATGFFDAGLLEPVRGGTGQDSSGSTGVPRVAAGTWSFDAGVSHLAASTSADFFGVISDEVGGTFVVGSASPTLTGTVTIDRRLEFTETAGDPGCAVGDFWISVTSDTNLLRKCQDGALSNLDTSGAVRWDEITDPTAVMSMTSNANAELMTWSFESALGATDVGFLLRQQTGNPVAGSILFDVQAVDTDILLTRWGGATNNIEITQGAAMTTSGTGSITATLGDSATGFFSSGNLELGILPFGTANQLLKTNTGGTAQEHATLSGSTNELDVAFGAGTIEIGLVAAPSITTSITSPIFISGAADPADVGVIRLGNTQTICWELATPGVDECLQLNASDVFLFDNPVEAATGYQITGNATAGRYLRHNAARYVESTGAASGTGTCTNQFAQVLNDDAAPTCATVTASDTDETTFTGVTWGANADFVWNFDTVGGANPDSVFSFTGANINVSTGTLQEGGVAVSLPARSETLTNKILDVEATGNVVTTISKFYVDAASCIGATATLNWDDAGTGDTAPAAACNDTGSIQRPSADFAGGAVNTFERTFRLPSDWASGAAVDVSIRYVSTAASPTGNVEYDISTVCRAAGETFDGTFNAIQTITDAVAAQNTLNDADQASVTMTNCAADEDWTLKISRDGTNDTNNDLAVVLGVMITLRRTQ